MPVGRGFYRRRKKSFTIDIDKRYHLYRTSMVCLTGACGEHDIAHIAYSFILMPARVLAFFIPSSASFARCHRRGIVGRLRRYRRDPLLFHNAAQLMVGDAEQVGGAPLVIVRLLQRVA